MRFDEPQEPQFDGLSNVIIFDDFFTVPSRPEPVKAQIKDPVSRISTWIGTEPPVVQVTLPGVDPLIS